MREERLLESKIRRVRNYWLHRSKSICMIRWRSLVEENLEKKRVMSETISIMMKRSEGQLLQRTLRRWSNWMEVAALNRIMSRARARSLVSLSDRRAISAKQRIFSWWSRHTFVQLHRGEKHRVTLSSLELKQHERTRKLEKKKMQRLVVEAVSTSKLLFTLESWWRRRLSSSLRLWSSVTIRMAREEHLTNKATRFRFHLHVERCFGKWYSHARKKKSVSRAMLSMQQRRRRGSAAQCLESWLRFVGRRTRLRSWSRSWIGRHRRSITKDVRLSFRRWSNETRKLTTIAAKAAAEAIEYLVAEKVAAEVAAEAAAKEADAMAKRLDEQQKQEEEERRLVALTEVRRSAAANMLKCWIALSRQSKERRIKRAFGLLCRNVVASLRALRSEHDALEARLPSMLTRTRLLEETKMAALRKLEAKRALQVGAFQLMLDRCMRPLRDSVVQWKFATIWSELGSEVRSGSGGVPDEHAAAAHYQAAMMARFFSAWQFAVLDDIYAVLSEGVESIVEGLDRSMVGLTLVSGGGGEKGGSDRSWSNKSSLLDSVETPSRSMRRALSVRDKVIHRIKSKASFRQTKSPSPSKNDATRKEKELRETF
jgi:hypothetical protein